MTQETELLDRITVRADIFGGKPMALLYLTYLPARQ